jgi:hypothetical protein
MSTSRLGLVTLVALASAACSGDAPSNPLEVEAPQLGVGNLLPTGWHFTLNLIGVKDKTAAMDASNDNGIGSRIFVALYFDDGDNTGECWEGNCPVDLKMTNRKNKIVLQPGEDFAVLDANATDQDGALLQLPTDVSSTYLVFARPLGKPGGSATMTTCATVLIDPDPTVAGDEYEEVLCSLSHYFALREKGKPTTKNVTAELLSIQVEIDPLATDPLTTCLVGEGYSGTADVPLFDPCFEGWFWDYDNHGLKLLQLRFYPAV